MLSFQEHPGKSNLYPLTLIRDTAELFCGAFTNIERWNNAAAAFHINNLQNIPSNVIPLFPFWDKCRNSGLTDALVQSKYHLTIHRHRDFIQHNESIIKADIELLKKIKTFQPIPSHVKITGSSNDVLIEEGVTLEHITINTTGGPVYISKDALIMDGTCLRGPVFIGKNAVVKMGTVIYGGTSIGEKVIAGGEIKNSIIHSFSNKAHHGYLGDSIIGEWCNLGAGTSVSNVKNTGGDVMLWNMHAKEFESAGNKCGTIMGDFTRTAINTSLNTGSVIGICTNLISSKGQIPKYIPNFTWLQEELKTYTLEKALIDIQNWMNFKGEILTIDVKNKLETLFNSRIL